MKHNFHTHTTRCKHAIGTDEDYVKAALDGGFDVLGFADHAPWAFETDYVSHCRMLPTQWEDYKQSVLALKEKYRGQIDIHLGLECEHYDKYFDQLLRLRDDGCEYFILGCHFLYSEENNPYVGEIAMRDGLPVSNREGHGYGCRSIRSITKRNGGLCSFEAEQGMFTVRVVLPVHEGAAQ